ncbi:hypothetical protein E4U31_002697 [Claviceps sp. LM219 group G6]|nr:hypothetical protein E4U31_002697 [Claviceps sp. LM219 group G6]
MFYDCPFLLMSAKISSPTPFLPALPPLHLNRGRSLASGLSLPKSLSRVSTSTNLGNGLRTPPVDQRSATYTCQPAMTYNGQYHLCNTSPPKPNFLKPVMDDVRTAQQYRYPSQQIQSQYNDDHHSTSTQSTQAGLHASDPVTPASDHYDVAQVDSKSGPETLIYHSLQIPKCISSTGGNLSDFAAQMTCLFWFESVDELKMAESIRSTKSPSISQLPALARPHEQFQKWAHKVLSTTQVTQNVIFLALLFIYRLRLSTPQIKGRAGSEYRLLTVALMLGNKFLDDNTYTNKTWAEVSCFAVQEIHVMEVEFLSNMRYNLLASKDEWEQWIAKLSNFHEYYDRASKLTASPIVRVSPTHRIVHSSAPSPTTSGLPSYISSSINTSLSPSSRERQSGIVFSANTTSPLARKFSIPRKRSPEVDLAEHPAKRHVQFAHAPLDLGPDSIGRLHNASLEKNILPVPHLRLVANQQASCGSVFTSLDGSGSHQMVSLPPLQSGTRAMSTVYQPNPSVGGIQQPTSAIPIGTSASTSGSIPHASAGSYSMATLPTQAAMGYGTSTKHHSPGRLLANYGTSPLVDSFAPGSAAHTPGALTPISNSPSVYLQHRASPYKPIRHVNRLLYPPPSASLDQYHMSAPVHPNQMHYQPIGRRHDLRTGIVPEFLLYNRSDQQHLPSQSMSHYSSS